jgi:hypothetical protein
LRTQYQAAPFPFNLVKHTIQVTYFGDICLYASDITPDLLTCGGELLLAAAGYEHIGTFVHKSVRGGQAYPAAPASNHCNPSFEFAHRNPTERFPAEAGALRKNSRFCR